MLSVLLHVQRLDGEWEGLGAVLTRSPHTLDSILISVLLGRYMGSLIMIYMTVQRLDGEWEGLGAVLTHSLHTLSSQCCWAGVWAL